jgi:hypothetical protein
MKLPIKRGTAQKLGLAKPEPRPTAIVTVHGHVTEAQLEAIRDAWPRCYMHGTMR